MVERISGCPGIRCRCGATWYYSCGAKCAKCKCPLQENGLPVPAPASTQWQTRQQVEEELTASQMLEDCGRQVAKRYQG